MSTKKSGISAGKEKKAPVRKETASGVPFRLPAHYGCGPIPFTGNDGLYDRHLLFDNVLSLSSAGRRERFEAAARSVRDVLSQRWILSEDTYERENAKRVYYLSMEFLMGRALSNNVVNLLLGDIVRDRSGERDVDWLDILEEEPDAGLGNGGLGRLAACFLDSMATMQLPAMGYGLRYEYGIFKQSMRDGWQVEQPDNWLRRADPWEVGRPYETVEIKLNSSFELREGVLRAIPVTAGRRASYKSTNQTSFPFTTALL
ncbi:MAG: glycogen/starch/alpha-glucan phosphorylase, partial [Syntrophorhabdus sp.]